MSGSISDVSLRQPSRLRHDFPELFAVSLPKRIFQWLYSFSLIIFIFLTAAFIVVTPLDIVVQTYGAPYTGIKMFIIIAACALFLLALILFYFSRLIQSREAVNLIPSKSVYVPLEKHDLPRDVLKHIDTHLHECAEIAASAGPLHIEEAFNYPGMLPPKYIQDRNALIGRGDQGTLLPPDCVYEDILDSLALRIRLDGALLTNYRIPTGYTFRDVIMSIYRSLSVPHQHLPETVATTRTVVQLYEKMRFSSELISESDMVAFLLAIERFSVGFMNNNTNNANNINRRNRRNSQVSTASQMLGVHRSMHNGDTGYGQASSTSQFSRLNRGLFDSRYRFPLLDNDYRPETESWARIARTSTGNSTGNSSMRTSRRQPLSVSTTGSVIRDRLAHRQRNYNPIGEDTETQESLRAYSGYWTDSEGETVGT